MLIRLRSLNSSVVGYMSAALVATLYLNVDIWHFELLLLWSRVMPPVLLVIGLSVVCQE